MMAMFPVLPWINVSGIFHHSAERWFYDIPFWTEYHPPPPLSYFKRIKFSPIFSTIPSIPSNLINVNLSSMNPNALLSSSVISIEVKGLSLTFDMGLSQNIHYTKYESMEE
jgi:hypothetical protein